MSGMSRRAALCVSIRSLAFCAAVRGNTNERDKGERCDYEDWRSCRDNDIIRDEYGRFEPVNTPRLRWKRKRRMGEVDDQRIPIALIKIFTTIARVYDRGSIGDLVFLGGQPSAQEIRANRIAFSIYCRCDVMRG